MHGGSTTATSINGGCGALTLPDLVLEDEVHETAKVLGGALYELKVMLVLNFPPALLPNVISHNFSNTKVSQIEICGNKRSLKKCLIMF
jgi:hypothetical protein